MIINTLELQNFGIYSGRNELDLTPETKYNKTRPVILIGGKNGAGKSTMFEAIKLCLYGKKSLEGKVSQKEYLEYLDSRINWYTPEDETVMIKMTFSLYRDNIDPTLAKEYKYDLTREWYREGNTVKEEFTIYQDNVLIELDEEFWEDFIEEVIPQGVIDLFFFDGEKIQGLAEANNAELEKSIKALLNLAIIPTLSRDLRNIYKRHIEQGADKVSKNIIAQTNNDIKRIQKELQKLTYSYGEATTKVGSVKRKIESLEKKLKETGGEFYEERDHLKSEEGRLKANVNQVNLEIGSDCGELTPFLLAPNLVKRVLENVEEEVQAKEIQSSQKVLMNKKAELEKKLKKILKESKIDKSKDEEIYNKVSGFLASWESESNIESKYNIGPIELREVKARLSNNHLEKFLKDFDKLEGIHRSLDTIQKKIEAAANDDVIISIHEQINEQNLILGQKSKDQELILKEKNQRENELKILQKNLQKVHDRIDRSEDQSLNYEKIDQVVSVLKKFEDRLTKIKVANLEDEILNCYRQIHRKNGFISRVNINAETFDVTMFDNQQRVIPVDKLSAGEKQVYATSVLWALSNLSGQSLPMVIDTPLGRLDSEHRDNLIKNFFPNASHQVVILSTDTEIDEEYYTRMKNDISHTYCIDFSIDDKNSNVGGGYLFNEGKA
ncbi:DNA sulfur modification protein DndD [Halobacteriovorax sp. CON-3]|uniref:DNA sulfur modification protein DndD n=1 Tax=Halobacteriovorax sp. CON-3 TaxID=3157710 RepID=UPI0037180425